jgi:hypothetical protein
MLRSGLRYRRSVRGSACARSRRAFQGWSQMTARSSIFLTTVLLRKAAEDDGIAEIVLALSNMGQRRSGLRGPLFYDLTSTTYPFDHAGQHMQIIREVSGSSHITTCEFMISYVDRRRFIRN